MPARRARSWTIALPAAAVRCRKGRSLAPSGPSRAVLAAYSVADGAFYVKPAARNRVRAFLRAKVGAGGRWHFRLPGRGKSRRTIKALVRNWRLFEAEIPEEGDIRIKQARCINVTRQFNCELVPGTTPPLYLSSRAVRYGQCRGVAEHLCSESYEEILGKADIRVYDDAACTRLSNMDGHFRFLDWTCLEL